MPKMLKSRCNQRYIRQTISQLPWYWLLSREVVHIVSCLVRLMQSLLQEWLRQYRDTLLFESQTRQLFSSSSNSGSHCASSSSIAKLVTMNEGLSLGFSGAYLTASHLAKYCSPVTPPASSLLWGWSMEHLRWSLHCRNRSRILIDH